MRLDRIARDDIVEARIKGRVILGRVTEVNGGIVNSARSAPAPDGITRKRARSPRTGERQDGGAGVRRTRQTRLRRSTNSCRWRTLASEPPQRDRADTGDVEPGHGVLEALARQLDRQLDAGRSHECLRAADVGRMIATGRERSSARRAPDAPFRREGVVRGQPTA
jgi:hypothetical protein